MNLFHLYWVYLTCLSVCLSVCLSPLAVCGSHHWASGHQRQEPAVHRVCDRQQRQDPRQRALCGGGGGLVKATVRGFTVEQRQYVIIIHWRSLRSSLCQMHVFILLLLHVTVPTLTRQQAGLVWYHLIPELQYWYQNNALFSTWGMKTYFYLLFSTNKNKFISASFCLNTKQLYKNFAPNKTQSEMIRNNYLNRETFDQKLNKTKNLTKHSVPAFNLWTFLIVSATNTFWVVQFT